jgi:hypothetical protein
MQANYYTSPSGTAALPRSSRVVTISLSTATFDAILARLIQILQIRHFLVDRDAGVMADLGGDAIADCVPAEQLRTISEFTVRRTEAILIVPPKGAQLPPLPPTPINGFGNDHEAQLLDLVILGFLKISGSVPVAYQFENRWHLMRNVVARPNAGKERSSHGSMVPFTWHTDNPCGQFERIRAPWMHCTPIPHKLAFGCVRNLDGSARPVSTDVLLLSDIRRYARSEWFAAMQRPEFQVNPPESNSCAPLKNVPLIETVDGDHFLRFDSDHSQVFGLTPLAERTLRDFRMAIEAAEHHTIRFAMTPFSILLFDNYRVVHSRRSFDPGLDQAQSRWLRRCYGLSSSCAGRHVDPQSWPHLVA